MATFDVLALDLEGTLISNAVSQIPRPGLIAFLTECRQLFPRVVIFTAVSEPRCRQVVRLLADEGTAPAWFRDVEYVRWSGPTKDLAFVPNAAASQCLLVDDMRVYVCAGQESQWIPVRPFDAPYSDDDAELVRALDLLRLHRP